MRFLTPHWIYRVGQSDTLPSASGALRQQRCFACCQSCSSCPQYAVSVGVCSKNTSSYCCECARDHGPDTGCSRDRHVKAFHHHDVLRGLGSWKGMEFARCMEFAHAWRHVMQMGCAHSPKRFTVGMQYFCLAEWARQCVWKDGNLRCGMLLDDGKQKTHVNCKHMFVVNALSMHKHVCDPL